MTKLFDDFDGISAQAWKQKIQMDLKGADYNNTLIWHSREGIDVKPFYHRDDFSEPFLNVETKSTHFKILKEIHAGDVKQANHQAIASLKEGIECISFRITNETNSLAELFKGLESIPIHLTFEILNDAIIDEIIALGKTYKLCLELDIIGHLAHSGNWYHNLKEDHRLLEKIISASNLFETTLSIDMSLYQNSGANMIQQLAYGLAHATEYLNHFKDGLNNSLLCRVSIGSNYFFEIAKLRALRLLWTSIASNFNAPTECVIVASPSRRNKTIYDYNTNMLRTTTECMSAILGGADVISNMPYDAVYHKANDFGDRISKNQLLILKHESYFNWVENPSDGAYYIESLTQQLAEKALTLFKDIEKNGGFLVQLKEGTIQRKIKESAQKEQEAFDSGEEILLGTNKHPNDQDKMKHDIELYPFLKIKKRKTLIEPILIKRLAEKIEQERLKIE